MMFTKYPESWDGRFDHGDVVGSEDDAEDSKDIWGIQREVPRGLLDQSGEDLERNLDISTAQVSSDAGQSDLPPVLHIPYSRAPYIARGLLLEEGADLLHFAPPSRGIV
jgi:hypothetical protein